MAITDVVPGVEVAITVRGNDLKEYRDNELDEEVSTTTRYVEAASGQTFEVRLKVKPNFRFLGDTLAFEILVDGNWMETPLIDKQQCGGLGYQRIIRGVTTSARTLRRFQFATLDPVSDGPVGKDDATRFKHLGTINVRVMQQWKVGLSKDYVDANTTELGTVSEKALKGQAISHRIKLKEPERGESWTTWDLEDVRGCPSPIVNFVFKCCPSPIVNFVFKYRSLDDLKAERIIPRTPTPGPLEDRDPTTLTVDELRELQRRLKELRDEQDTKIQIKREAAEDEEQPRRRKTARPSTDSTQLELDEDGSFRESSMPTVPVKREVIELD